MVATTTQPGASRLARNFAYLLSSQLTTFVLSILATVVIPRYLGAVVIGRLELATAVWLLGAAVIGFGMNLAITKAVARDHSLIGAMFCVAVTTRLLLAIPVAAAVFTYVFGVGYATQVAVLVAILAVGTLFETVASVADAVLLGVERVGAISIAAVAGRLVAVAGAVALLAGGFGVYAVAAVGVGGSLLTMAIYLRAAHSVWRELDGLRPRRPTRQDIVAFMKDCAPYFGIAFFMIAYRQVDTIVISLVVDDEAVLGWYSVYDRLAGTLMFIPVLFIAVVYPVLSRSYEEGQRNDVDQPTDDLPPEARLDEYRTLAGKSFRLMVLISIPAGLGLAVLARPVVQLLYGDEFVGAAPVVSVGAIVVSLTYLNSVFSMFLISMDRQRPITVLLAICVALTIPLDIALVQFFQTNSGNGAIGGAVSYAITESLMLAGAIYLLPRGSLDRGSAAFVGRVLVCGAMMTAVVIPLRGHELPVPIAAGVLTYVLAIVTLGVLTDDDRRSIISAIPARFRPGA